MRQQLVARVVRRGARGWPLTGSLPLLLAIVATLAGCQAQGDLSPAQVISVSTIEAAALVARVRAAANADDAVEVTPLGDGQTEDLRAAAERLEALGDYVGAAQALQRALLLTPGDPALLQEAAELALLQRDWDQAIQLAGRSFESGPRLGSLCRRNWATVQVAREQFGDTDGSVTALAQLSRCTIAPPVRM